MSRFCSGSQSAEPVVRKLGADGVGRHLRPVRDEQSQARNHAIRHCLLPLFD
jgi:hypothetical protein